MTRCQHCRRRSVTPVCPACAQLLAEIGEEPEPATIAPEQPRTTQQPFDPAPAIRAPERPYRPTQADEASYLEMSLRGSFRPYRSHVLPSHVRSRWGTALTNWEKAGCPKPPPKQS